MERYLRPAANTSVAPVGGEMAVLRTDTGDVLVLNGSATEIWELCDGRHSVQDIVDALRAQYPTADRLGDDVERAVETFLVRGFVVDGVPPAGDEADGSP